MSISLEPVGTVRGGRTEPTDDGWADETCVIELDAERFDAGALAGLDEFSHVEVVYHFHLVDEADVVTGVRHPRGRRDWPAVGIFAQRGRVRPNRLGVSVCQVLGVDGLRLAVRGLDAVDGTPVLDVKPYLTGFAPRGEVREPAWARELMASYWHVPAAPPAAPAARPPSPEPRSRRAFLDARRRSHAARLDVLAPEYDRDWGAIAPTHEAFVRRLLGLVRPGGTLLDAACGTGKYWPLVLAAGRSVVGTDQSAGMLRVAAAKHPSVPLGLVGLQELAFDALFDGLLCVDALENVGPEDWPAVVARLRDAVRPGAPLYLTVELAETGDVARAYELARARGEPVVPGEDFDGIGYHFYPEASAVDAWLADAGLEVLEEGTGDEYRHLLVRRPA